MQQSALDMVRARAAKPLGEARDALAAALARARLLRDEQKFGTRGYHDIDGVASLADAALRRLDDTHAALVGQTAAPSPQQQAERAGAAKPAAPKATGKPDLVLGAILRTLLTGPCGDPTCESCKAAFGDPTPKAPNGSAVGVTDRAG